MNRMKVGVIVFGSILAVVGILLFLLGYTQLQQTSGFPGDLQRFFSPTARQAYETAQIIRNFGIVVGLSGLGLIAFGIFSKKG